jgi:CHAT domain-containing protein
LRLPEAFDRTRVQALLRPDQAAVVYLLGVKQSLALVLRADGPPQPVHLDLSRDSARRLAAEIASAMESGAPREDWQAPLRHAHRALIEALQPHLRGARELVLVPDLELYLLPFAALIDAEERFLIQDYAISQAYSLSLLAQLETAASPAQEQLLAVADPASEGVAVPVAYRALKGPDLAPLPHARREVQAIASLFGDAAQQLSGAAVTETAVAAAASDADVLHLAVHGYFDPVHSARSGLVLAAGGAEESGDDGLLTVAEVAADWRLDAALVVLSACHTGRGELSAAEGLFGLTRAFQYAGARAVLSSLWAVPDRSTEVLMVEFHRQRQRGIGHAEALRLAQLQLLGRPAQGASRGVGGLSEPDRRNELAAPWHWAAFSLNGARGRLVQARP